MTCKLVYKGKEYNSGVELVKEFPSLLTIHPYFVISDNPPKRGYEFDFIKAGVIRNPFSVNNQNKYRIEIIERYSDELVKENPNKIYVFGDNVLRKGKKGQAVIRDNPNAIGIATKKKPSISEDSYFSDSEFEENKKIIDEDIQRLKEISKGKTIVFPKDGIGTGLAKLKEKAPKTYEYLKQKLLDEFNFSNEESVDTQNKESTSQQFKEWLQGKRNNNLLPEYRDLLNYAISNNLLSNKPIKKVKGTKLNITGIIEKGDSTIFNQRANLNNKKINTSNNTFKELSKDEIKNLSYNQIELFEKINPLIEKISKSLGIKIVYVNDESLNFKGQLNTNNNTVVINLAYSTLDTPIHELLGHPLISYIKKNNSTLYTNLVNELKNSEEGLEILNKVKELYHELSEDKQYEEAIVELISLRSANKIHSNKLKTLISKVIDSIKRFINNLFPTKNQFELSDNMSLKEISNLIDNYVRELDYDISDKIRSIVKEVLNYDLGEIHYQNVNNGWSPKQIEKKYKKAFGETAYRLIRDTASGLLIEPEKAITWIKEKIPVKSHTAFVIEKVGASLEKKYLEFLSNPVKGDIKKKIQDPFELIRKAGYEVTEIQEPGDALTFKRYYGEGEVLCTYNNVEGRLSENIILWIKRPNAENILPADKLTQENLSTEWKEYLEKEGRKNTDGSYNLKGLPKESKDPYGRSVVSIQISRENGYLKEINRYNHRLDKGSVDNTFNKNLDNLIDGLHDSIYEKYGIKPTGFSDYDYIPNLIQDAKGSYYFYLDERNGYYYFLDGYLYNGEYYPIDKNTQRVIGGYLFDIKTKKISQFWEDDKIEDVANIKFTKYDITILYKNGSTLTLEHDSFGNVLSIKGDVESLNFNTLSEGYNKVKEVFLPNITNIGNNFLLNNKNLETLSLPNVKEIGNDFLRDNETLKTLSLPNIKKIGNNFLRDNENLEILLLPNIKKIGNDFLPYNENLETLSLPEVEEIGNNFLRENENLEILLLPNIKKIGNDFLPYNENLETLSLPKVKEIGSDFLRENETLKTLSLPNIKKIGNDFLILNKNLKTLSLPEVEEIGNNFLLYNETLKTLSLPNIKKIGNNFLRYNKNLEDISQQFKRWLEGERNTEFPLKFQELFNYKITFRDLSEKQKEKVKEKGYTSETFDKLSEELKDKILKC